jgi:hypothetical protein
MPKRYSFWLWVAIVLQLLNATLHSLSLIRAPVATNATEQQLFDLMVRYRLDLGAGIHRSMWDLFRALSSCFTLLCLLGGFTNIYLLRKKVDAELSGDLVVFSWWSLHRLRCGRLNVLAPDISRAQVLFLAIAYFTTPKTTAVNTELCATMSCLLQGLPASDFCH